MDEATPFACPTCGAEYKVVRVEAKMNGDEGQLTAQPAAVHCVRAEVALCSNTSALAGHNVTLCGHANGVGGEHPPRIGAARRLLRRFRVALDMWQQKSPDELLTTTRRGPVRCSTCEGTSPP